MTQTRTLSVPDMSCGHCELSVQEALDGLGGVRGSKADHKMGTVEVTYEADKVTHERFEGAIEEVGYTVRS